MEIFEVILKAKLQGSTSDRSNVALIDYVAANANGILYSQLAGSFGAISDTLNPGDGRSPTALDFLNVAAYNALFNGSTIDRERGNIEETVLASAARTASVNSADFTNYNNKGGHFIVDVTAITATPSITMTVQGKDPVSGSYYDILVCTTITATGTNVFKVYPGIPGSANVRANDVLPRSWRVSIAHGDADSITYSVGFNSVR